jgi:excisionase family DNA binding protein
MAKQKDLLRSKDVAWILDLSPDDVIDLARNRKLKATKLGRFWRFHPDDVMAYKRRRDKNT